jgi:hypothetical protein
VTVKPAASRRLRTLLPRFPSSRGGPSKPNPSQLDANGIERNRRNNVAMVRYGESNHVADMQEAQRWLSVTDTDDAYRLWWRCS